jgi:hypothetical protein
MVFVLVALLAVILVPGIVARRFRRGGS